MKHGGSEIREKKRFVEHSRKYRIAYLLQVSELYGELDELKEIEKANKSEKPGSL